MTKTELATACKVSLPTVTAWISKGCPYTCGKDGRYQFDRKQVERWRKDTVPPRSATPAGSPSYSVARARKETALAGLRELQLRQKTGELVAREAVEKAVFSANRQARDNLLNIPAREAGILASFGGDQDKIYQELTRAIHEVLKELSHETTDPGPSAARPHRAGA